MKLLLTSIGLSNDSIRAALVRLLGRPISECSAVQIPTADFPDMSDEAMQRAAAKVDEPLYAIDDQTAIVVVDGEVEVVSEGDWMLFNSLNPQQPTQEIGHP
jgi:dipeptidase E